VGELIHSPVCGTPIHPEQPTLDIDGGRIGHVVCRREDVSVVDG